VSVGSWEEFWLQLAGVKVKAALKGKLLPVGIPTKTQAPSARRTIRGGRIGFPGRDSAVDVASENHFVLELIAESLVAQ
jgi:hypothetical protein